MKYIEFPVRGCTVELCVALHGSHGIWEGVHDGKMLKQTFFMGGVSLYRLDEDPLVRIMFADILPYHRTSPSEPEEAPEATAPPVRLTYGDSKDKRPDLKQFVLATLCVDLCR